MWKDFFYFSRAEKQGILILIILICIVLCMGVGWSVYSNKQAPTLHSENFEEEYKRFANSLRKEEPVKTRNRYTWAEKHHASNRTREVVLRSFDPNTADSVVLSEIGLSPRIIKNILNYRGKGGIFRTPEDVGKIYSLSEEQYADLLPYIHIGDAYRKKNIPQLLRENRPSVPDTLKQIKYPAGTIVLLNTADTTELKKIPGIGSALAKRIVGYRNRLGGYHQVAQLEEIGLNIAELTAWFKIENGETSRINLNKVGIERLKAHPYFNFYQAKVVIEYRKKRGALKHLSQLSLYDEFTDEDLERMKHYICFE